jgi:hypothetical protein
MPELKWAYGLTTVPSRFDVLLPRTLASLALAGFPTPRLFVDGDFNREHFSIVDRYPHTVHHPALRTHGNWVLGMYELYIREPLADRYALFQDDFVTYRNLRQYLDASPYPGKGYLNLYLFPEEVQPRTGWYESRQNGKGAVALVFDNESLRVLLTAKHLVDRPRSPARGHKCIDGGIVDSMKEAGYKEYVHNPSLVQHTGMISSMENGPHPQANTFKGESFDATDLLGSHGNE